MNFATKWMKIIEMFGARLSSDNKIRAAGQLIEAAHTQKRLERGLDRLIDENNFELEVRI